MSKLTLTEAELHQLGCTPEEGAELEARDRRTQRAAKLARLEADLPKLRAKADLQRDLQGRSINGIERERTRQRATATPTSDTDFAIVSVDIGRDRVIGDDLRIPKALRICWATEEEFELGEFAASGVGEEGWERTLVICRERHPDLRTMIKAGFNDPLHDAFKGRPRHHWEAENDPANIDALVAAIVATTTDRDLLDGWLEAAGDQQHAIALRARFDKLFGHKDPDFWGGKDDKHRIASPVGHVSIGARG